MNKNLFIYLMVFLPLVGFTQTEMNPCFLVYESFNLISLPDSNSQCSPSTYHRYLNQLQMYGIKYRLTINEETPSKNLLNNEKPVFDVSTLHQDEVLEDIIKILRYQDFDFSGLIKEFYRPTTINHTE